VHWTQEACLKNLSCQHHRVEARYTGPSSTGPFSSRCKRRSLFGGLPFGEGYRNCPGLRRPKPTLLPSPT